MLTRKLVTFGLFSTLMLLGLSCGEPPSDEDANVRIIVLASSSAPSVIDLMFSVSPAGEDVVFDAESRINFSGQAEVDLAVTSGGVPKVPNIPQITLNDTDSGCIGCPENTIGTGSYTETGMTPGDYTIPIAIHYPGQSPNASAVINLTLDQEPGAEYGYILPAQQTAGAFITVVVKPVNPEGPLTDLELTAEFQGVTGSKVTLVDSGGSGIYVSSMTAPAAGSHTMEITITNTATGGVTVITQPYTTVP